MTEASDIATAQASLAKALTQIDAALGLVGTDDSGATSPSGAPHDTAAKANLAAAFFGFTEAKVQVDAIAADINPPVPAPVPVPTPTPTPTPRPTPTGKVALGTYTDPQGSWASTTKFGTETGCKVSIRTDYAARTQATFLNDLQYVLGLDKGMPYKLALGVPLVDDSQSPVWANAVGNGPWVALHKQAIAVIKASGITIEAIRLAIEGNIGTTTPFTYNTPGFVPAWNTIAPLYRAAGYLVEFNTVTQTGINVIAVANQIKANFDIWGVDVYDQWYGGNPNNTPADTVEAWDSIINGADGLNAVEAWCRANGKKMSFPEWGVGKKGDGHGLGDDPNFIAESVAFVEANADIFAYVSYFDTNNGWDTVLADSPNSLAEFKKVGPAVFGAA